MRGSKVKDLGRIFLGIALCWLSSTSALGAAPIKVFKVGVLVSDTGDLKSAGVEMRRAAVFAAKDFDAKHAGRARLQLVFVDDESRAEAAAQRAETLVREHKVQAVVGPAFLAGATAAASLFSAAGIAFVVPLARASNWGADKNTRFLRVEEFRLGEALANFAASKLSAKSVVVVDEATSDASRSFNDGFLKASAQKKLKTSPRLSFVSFAEESPKLLSEIAKLKPDVVSLPTSSWEAARAFLDPAPSQGVPAIFLGGSSWAGGGEKSKVPGPIGHFFVDVFSTSYKGSRAFVDRFRGAHGAEPSVLEALSYEAVSVLGQAYTRAGFQAAVPLQKVLKAPLAFEGVAGRIQFRSDSTPQRDLLVLETTQSGIARFRQVQSSK
jgi:branched-chain amino acid transport system substrate-binding protein